MLNLILAHKTELSLMAAWLFSAIMSSMPPVDQTKICFASRWLLSFAQFLAANLHKV